MNTKRSLRGQWLPKLTGAVRGRIHPNPSLLFMFYYESQDILQKLVVEKIYFPIEKGKGFIYTLRDGLDGEVRYVGKTVDYRKRLNHHRTNPHCSEAFKVWRANLRHFMVLEIIAVTDVENLPLLEQEKINYYKSQNLDLLNIATAKKETDDNR